MEVEYKVLEIAGAEEKKMGFFHTAVKCSVTINKCGECASREQGTCGGWEGEGVGEGDGHALKDGARIVGEGSQGSGAAAHMCFESGWLRVRERGERERERENARACEGEREGERGGGGEGERERERDGGGGGIEREGTGDLFGRIFWQDICLYTCMCVCAHTQYTHNIAHTHTHNAHTHT